MNSKEHDPIKKSIDTKQIYRIVPPILFLVSTIAATITFTTAYNTSTGYIQDSFQKIRFQYAPRALQKGGWTFPTRKKCSSAKE